MKIKTLFLIITCSSLVSFASSKKMIEPTPSDILELLGYSYWNYEIENPTKKTNVRYQIIHYSLNDKGDWKSSCLQDYGSESINNKKKVLVSIYQKGNKITAKYNSVTSTALSQIDLSDLGVSFRGLLVDENKEIILKVKGKNNKVGETRSSWQKYLALRITFK